MLASALRRRHRAAASFAGKQRRPSALMSARFRLKQDEETTTFADRAVNAA
jgi:hypothetical protein